MSASPITKRLSFGTRKFCSFLFTACVMTTIVYLMTFSDGIIIGHLFGTNGLAGLSLCIPPIEVISFFATLLGFGTTVCFATEIGRYEKRRASEFVSQGLYSTFLCGILLMICGVVFRDPYLRAAGVNADILRLATGYWDCYIPVAFLSPVAIFLASLCYADGDNSLCAIAYLVQLVSNCIFSYILGKIMGICGCAVGTVLGNLLAIFVLLIHFFKKSNAISICLHFNLKDLWKISVSAFGLSGIYLWKGLFLLFLNQYILSRFGERQLAIVLVAYSATGVMELLNSVPEASLPVVNVYVGEKNDLGIRTVMRFAIMISLLLGLWITVFFLFFPQVVPYIVGLTDKELYASSITAVRLVCFTALATSLVYLFNAYFLYLSHLLLAVICSLMDTLILPVCCVLFWGNLMEISGVWLGMGTASFLTVIFCGTYLLLRYGKRRFPLLLDPNREKKQRMWTLELTPEEICSTAAEVSAFLSQKKICTSASVRAQLIIEEVYMTILEYNGKKRIHAEITVDLNDSFFLTLRDDGQIFDYLEKNPLMNEFRNFTVQSLVKTLSNRITLTTTGFNRNAFVICTFGREKQSISTCRKTCPMSA